MIAPTAVSPRIRDRWRTWAWILAALVAIAVTAFIVTESPIPGGRLDPEATTARGAHALAQLLRDRGVAVEQVTGVEQARGALRPGSQLMVVDNGYLTDEAAQMLAGLPGDRLLLSPFTNARSYLAPRVQLTGTEPDSLVNPDCRLPEAQRAGVVSLRIAETYRFSAPGTGQISCYGGALVRYTEGDRTITVLGDDTVLTNAQLGRQGNAALAMNLAGRSTHLVWYLPQRPASATANQQKSFADLVPAGVKMAVWQLCVAVLLLALWRGRRMGPLVAERLPVVVRASETTEGRAKLYRSRRARDRSSAALRDAAHYRIVHRLGLPLDSTPEVVGNTVAQRIGRDPVEIHAVLFGPVPADDLQLATLVQQLDVVERQVRDS